MSFQLLAFFILTFQAPSRETRIDLYLPIAPIALPGTTLANASTTPSLPSSDLEDDLVIRARADDLGDLQSLVLLGAAVRDASELESRLRNYVKVLGDEPVRARLIADEALRYEEAARLVSACSAAGIRSLRLGGPDELTAEPIP